MTQPTSDSLVARFLALPSPAGMPPALWLDAQVQLLLLILGSKLATTVAAVDEGTQVEASLTQLATSLERLGLETYLEPQPEHGYYYLHVADGSDSLATLVKIHSGELPEAEANQEHGRLSGFPATAIAAFNGQTLIDPAELSAEVRHSSAYTFGTFRYSRAHWQAELQIAQAWADAIQRVAPDVYAGYLQTFRED